MVGKAFPITYPDGERVSICLHDENTPTQKLHALDSPGGVDVAVAYFCYRLGVRDWHHRLPSQEDGSRPVFVAPIVTIISHGIQQEWDGRQRLFLPTDRWREFRAVWYSIPWITAERVVSYDDAFPGDEVPRLPGDPVPSSQPRLWWQEED